MMVPGWNSTPEMPEAKKITIKIVRISKPVAKNFFSWGMCFSGTGSFILVQITRVDGSFLMECNLLDQKETT